MRYVVASALVHGSLRQQAYSLQHLSDPVTRALMTRMLVSVDLKLDTAFPSERSARVAVVLHDGTRHEYLQKHRRGDPELPLSDEQLNVKFVELVSPVVGVAHAQTLLKQLWELERRPDVAGLGCA